MNVKQLTTIVNNATKEALGEEAILNEDLSNVVDIGQTVFNNNAFDNYVKSLINHIGKVVFVDRAYTGRAPSVLMDAWEFGSVLEKIGYSNLPEATNNESWDLNDGTDYSQDIFYKPTVEATFFNSKTTFEVPISITERQVKESFSNGTQLNAFVSMIYTAIRNSMTVKVDELIMRTINNFIGETLYSAFPSGTYTGVTSTKAVNLLYLYNHEKGTTLTKDKALTDLEFLKYASMTIALYKKHIGDMSTLFNIKGAPRFTPAEDLHLVLLDNFAEASKMYLQSDTYNKELVALPNYETVSYFQGTGTDYELDSISKIDIKTSGGHEIEIDYIMGVMFDRNALGVCNQNDRATTHYNAKAEFTNTWFKRDASYFNAQDENFVVFYLA